MDVKIFFLLGWLVTNLPAEPPEQYLTKEYVDNDIGMYFREYSIDNNDKVNYMTARHVPTIGMEKYDDTDAIIADEHPLFYWFDWNCNGKFDPDELWKDEEEKGEHVHPFTGTIAMDK